MDDINTGTPQQEPEQLQAEGQQAYDQTQQVDDQQQAAPYKPFSAGDRERIKIDGQEIEMSWDEIKKAASLSSAANKRFEEAAQVRKSAQSFMNQIREMAATNPTALLRVLNPNFQGALQQQPQGQHLDPRHGQRVEEQEPWAQHFDALRHENESLKQQIQQFNQRFEQQDVERERASLQQEFSSVQSKYPTFKDEAAMAYLKMEYRAALQRGDDRSLEDIAFQLNQRLNLSRAKQAQEVKNQYQKNRDRAPVTAAPPANTAAKSPESFDELRRSLGMV